MCRRLETGKVESSRHQDCHDGSAYLASSLPGKQREELIILFLQLPHLPTPSIPRGGANTSDHVDVLGSTGLNELIVKVATGAGDEIQDTFVSNIREYAKRMQWD